MLIEGGIDFPDFPDIPDWKAADFSSGDWNMTVFDPSMEIPEERFCNI